MIQRHRFVNRPGQLALLIGLQSLGLLTLGWSQDPTPKVESTEYYRQAAQRLGPASKVVWTEPGENSLDRWNPRVQIEVQGVVVSWDTDKLILVKPDGNGPTNFPGDLVIGIDPQWKSPAYAQVHQKYLQHQYREVLQQGQTALSLTEIPRWQQRLLVGEMVEAAVSIQQYATAGRVFKVIAQDSPPDLLMSRIPLPWADEIGSVTPGLIQESLSWMESENPILQLLGAAWLAGTQHRLTAIEKLKSLGSNSSSRVSEYAKVQLWRTTPPEEILSQKIQQWIDLRDRLSIPLQAGPTALLAYRLEQTNNPNLAIAEWLRVASLHSDRYHLVELANRRSLDLAKKSNDATLLQSVSSSLKQLKLKGQDSSVQDASLKGN